MYNFDVSISPKFYHKIIRKEQGVDRGVMHISNRFPRFSTLSNIPHTAGSYKLRSNKCCSSSVAEKSQIGFGRYDPNGICMTHTTAPPLHAHDRVAWGDDFELETLGDTPFQASIDVFLPDMDVEVWLWLGEIERVDAAV